MAKRKTEANRSDGRVNVSFRFQGKVYSVTGRTKEEALMKKMERLEKLKAAEDDRNDPTVRSYYDNVFTPNRRDKIRESTLRGQSYQFRDAAAVFIPGTGCTFGDLKMSEVKARDIHTVQKALRDSGRTTETTNNIMAHVSHVFNKALRDRTITWNPCTAVDKLQRTEPKAKDTNHRALTEQEALSFFEALHGSYYENICRLMIQTGLRIGEVGALYPADVDTKEGVIHVSKTISRREDGQYYVSDTPKTDSGNRDVPLNDTVLRILKDQQKQNSLIFGHIDLDKPIFRSREGELLREYFVNREISRKCKLTGIQHFTTHAFRATFATQFIEQRPQDYKILSEILGHADISITLNLYAAHKSKNLQAEAMKAINIAM